MALESVLKVLQDVEHLPRNQLRLPYSPLGTLSDFLLLLTLPAGLARCLKEPTA